MKLQIKGLKGIPEMQQNSNQSSNVYSGTVLPNTATETDNAFICEFNRPLNSTDTYPLTIKLKIFNNIGTEISEIGPLTVNQTDIVNYNSFRFNLTIPDRITGSDFYLLPNILNKSENTQNIKLSINNYHSTIAKIQVYAPKRVNHLYWSRNERILDMEQQESLRTEIGSNEDAFLHIKTQGMYNDDITFTISSSDKYKLYRQRIKLNKNKKTIVISMRSAIARYRKLANIPTGPINLKLRASITLENAQTTTASPVAVQEEKGFSYYASFILKLSSLPSPSVLPLALVAAFSDNRRETTNDTGATENESSNHTVTSEDLSVSTTPVDKPTKKTTTGTVFVRVKTTESEKVAYKKFTDFRIGYIGHLEGEGKKVNRYKKEENDNPAFTVYPLYFYEILVSDLVICKIITSDEAAYLAPLSETSDELEDSFNKFTAKVSENKTLLSLLQDIDRAKRLNSTVVRKLLARVKSRKPSETYQMCRDAWQISSKGQTADLPRSEEGRYNTNKECPPNDYFLNWVEGGTYRVYVSLYAAGTDIDEYPGINPKDPNRVRGGIALHRGAATASVGCITFNVPYNIKKSEKSKKPDDPEERNGWNAEFHGFIYPKFTNNSYLNMLCIDKRNATQLENDYHTVNGKENNYWRFYDLIKPETKK